MRTDTTSDIPTYSIGTVARMLGVSVATLRLYERKGLILARKSEGNQRLYSEFDVQRLRCIRTAINEHKISIEGIRRLQSMIPCWTYINCPMAERVKCPSYSHAEAGCWTHRHRRNDCAERECRSCKVYLIASDCESIKSEVIHLAESSASKPRTRQKP